MEYTTLDEVTLPFLQPSLISMLTALWTILLELILFTAMSRFWPVWSITLSGHVSVPSAFM